MSRTTRPPSRPARIGRAAVLNLAGALLVPMCLSAPAYAHGEVAVGQSVVVAPRAEARIGAQEVVIAYVDGKVVVFLQRYVDGLPTSGADVEITVDFIAEPLAEVAPGIYSSGDWPLAAGRNDIELAFTLDGQTATANVPLVVPSAAGDDTAVRSAPTVTVGTASGLVLATLALFVFAGVNLLLARRPGRV